MSNVTRIPDPPQLKVLGCFLSQLPPMIARKEVKYFTGGAISPKSVSNDDYLGNGPKFRMKMGDAVVYPTAFFLAYLEAKGVKLIESYSGAIGSNLRAYWQQKYENQGGISPAFFC